MRHTVLAGMMLAFLLSPSLVAAEDGATVMVEPSRKIEGLRPSRRSIREEAQKGIDRNPNLLTISEVPLDATYENAALGVKLHYPSAWEAQDVMEQSPPLTLVMMFLSPTNEGGVRQNANLVIEDLPTMISLAQYTDLGIETEQELFEDFTLLQSYDLPFLGSERAHRVVFTASANGLQMTFNQIWVVRDKRAYVWTFADAAENFDKHYPTFERMMETLTMR